MNRVTKDVALDKISYGAIQSAQWEAQDSTFPDPYSPGAALGVEIPLFWPLGAGIPQQAKSCQKGAEPETATGLAGGDAHGGVTTAGALG